jgi:CheY-like chemotaxis protein
MDARVRFNGTDVARKSRLVGGMVWGERMDTSDTINSTKFKPKVLYIEDNLPNAMLMKALFKGRIDADLTICLDAESGLAAATSETPNLIITDIRLPGMSGTDLLHILQETPSLKDVPVIALSSNAMTEEVAAAEAEGFYRYVTKPIQVGDVTALIIEALGISEQNTKTFLSSQDADRQQQTLLPT